MDTTNIPPQTMSVNLLFHQVMSQPSIFDKIVGNCNTETMRALCIATQTTFDSSHTSSKTFERLEKSTRCHCDEETTPNTGKCITCKVKLCDNDNCTHIIQDFLCNSDATCSFVENGQLDGVLIKRIKSFCSDCAPAKFPTEHCQCLTALPKQCITCVMKTLGRLRANINTKQVSNKQGIGQHKYVCRCKDVVSAGIPRICLICKKIAKAFPLHDGWEGGIEFDEDTEDLSGKSLVYDCVHVNTDDTHWACKSHAF